MRVKNQRRDMRIVGSAWMIPLAVASALAVAPAAAANWVDGAFGSMPPPTVTPNGGYEANGAPLFICRAAFRGGWHPGKIRQGFNGCNIGYGGREQTVSNYQVYTGRTKWRAAQFGQIPGGMINAGREADGQALGVCRAPWNGGLHPGKIRVGFGGCNIGFGGQEITVGSYEVLTR
jgi:hypothetical protein